MTNKELSETERQDAKRERDLYSEDMRRQRDAANRANSEVNRQRSIPPNEFTVVDAFVSYCTDGTMTRTVSKSKAATMTQLLKQYVLSSNVSHLSVKDCVPELARPSVQHPFLNGNHKRSSNHQRTLVAELFKIINK